MTRVLEILLCIVFIGSALAFGGVQPLAGPLTEVLLFLILLVLLWSQVGKGKISLSVPIWPCLFALVVALQVLPLPNKLVAGVNSTPRLDLAWTGTSELKETWATLTIYQNATVLALIKFLAYFSAFLLAARLFDSSKRKSLIIRSLVVLGCFEAAYGIIQYLLSWNKIFTYTNPYGYWVATGTYINRNHFAGLLELTLPFAFASAFYSYQLWSDFRQGRLPQQPGGNESSAGQQAIFYLFLVLIMVLGVLFSRSRGGILAMMISLAFVSILSVLKVRRKAWGLGILGFITLALGFGLWIGLGPVLSRFESVTPGNFLQMSQRASIWEDTVQIIRNHPVLGTGLGTFEQAFRPHQTGLVNDVVDHAHNDYLEFTSETGFVGATLLFIPIFYLLVRMVLAFLVDRRRYRRAVILGCIGSTLALLIHSSSDFNLHLPANAIIFAVILGIGYKAACIEPTQEAPKRTVLVN